MTDVVLDASAVLARLFGEPGGDRVAALMDDAHVSAVNVAEVAQKLVDRGATDDQVAALIAELPCEVEPFDAPAALRVGLLRRSTRPAGLSLADRACLDLARQRGRVAVTADRAWAELDLGVEVVLIR
jgi:PIN domain nuclease of toxin-antitoxin system